MASVKVERGEVLCRMSNESQFVDLWSLCIIQAISRLPRICFIHLRPRVRVISIYLFKVYARSATNDSDIVRHIHMKRLFSKTFSF